MSGSIIITLENGLCVHCMRAVNLNDGTENDW